ncbi:MAG TPA: response regulator, partial [Bacteroidetes bacterium]|nr:response regulator [Bacteroidota bacterium]
RILIVDDDVQIREMLQQKLHRSGYETVEATDGNVAIKLHSAQPADLIIMDLVMPEKEGIETIMELRRNFPDVKIIAISGGSRHLEPGNFLHLAKKLGAQHVLKKPFKLKDMLEVINQMLKNGE